MKIKVGIIAALLMPMGLWAANLATPDQQMAYALGASLGQSLQKNQVQIDLPSFMQGFQDAYAGKPLQLSKADMQKLMTQFQQQQIQKTQQKVQAMSSENLTKSEAFLAENKKQPGVVTLPSGLQYKVIEAGNGAQATPTSTVTVDYEGKLMDGKVFDSSYSRGKPITFALNQVIKGWQEGVALMKEGETVMLYIPPQLGYGAQGVPGVIPPNSALVFKVHLIAVKN